MASISAPPPASTAGPVHTPRQPVATGIALPIPSQRPRTPVPAWQPSVPQQHAEGPARTSTGPPQPGRTSTALIARRALEARDAKALTCELRDARSWHDLEHLFTEHKGKLNHIHMGALMTRLAHLCQGQPASRHAPQSPATTQSHNSGPSVSKQDAPALRLFLATVVPFIGMHMLSLGPRQLACIMWALGSLGYRPQPAWVVEWSSSVARKLHTFTPQDLAMSAWGLVACGATNLGNSSGAPGVLLQLSAAATSAPTRTRLRPQDISNLCWAVAASGLRPDEHVVRTLVEEADRVLLDKHTTGGRHNTQQTAHTTALSNAWASGRDAPGKHSDFQHAMATTITAAATTDKCFSPVELTTLLWALAKLGYWPGDAFLQHMLHHFLGGTAMPALSSHTAPSGIDGATPAGEHGAMHAGIGREAVEDDGVVCAEPAATSHVQGRTGGRVAADRRHSTANQAAGARHHALVLWALARLQARPETTHIERLLAGSLGLLRGRVQGTLPWETSGVSGHTSMSSDMGDMSRGGTSLTAADLAQTVWSLGRLRFQPPPGSWRRLMPGVIAALAATAAEAVDDLVPVDLGQIDQLNLGRAGQGVGQRGPGAGRGGHSAQAFTGRVWLPIKMTKSMRVRLARRRLWRQWRQRGSWPHNQADDDDDDDDLQVIEGQQEALFDPQQQQQHQVGPQPLYQQQQQQRQQQQQQASAPWIQLSHWQQMPMQQAQSQRQQAPRQSSASAAAVGPLSGSEVVAVLWGLRRLRLPARLARALQEMVPRVLLAITPELGQLSLLAIVQLMSSCAMLKVTPPDVFVEAWADRVVAVLPAMDEEQLAKVLLSLVVVRKRPPQQFILTATKRVYALMTRDVQQQPTHTHTICGPTDLKGRIQVNRGAAHQPEASSSSIHQVMSMFPSSTDLTTTTTKASGSSTITTTGALATHTLPTSTQDTTNSIDTHTSHASDTTKTTTSPPRPRTPRPPGTFADGSSLSGVVDKMEKKEEEKEWDQGVRWRGTPTSLVTVLWALGKLRGSALSGAWSNAAVACAAHAVLLLRPAEMSRLLEAVRILQLRPTRRVAGVLAARCRTVAAWRSAQLGCEEQGRGSPDSPCSIVWEGGVMEGMGGPECEVTPPCRHLQRVPERLRAWRLALVADEKRMNAAARRSYTSEAGDALAPL